ncbi:hypothetical protein [Aeromonas enteropelogenes]|uniref:hypothetical protein n=1 Tax=Aeromonas enteropelogenes TaxID=29489 RepID=UPI003B9F7380
MTRIHITRGPKRRKPKAGDEKVVKGITYIRQQVRTSHGYQVTDHGPVWEWVEKGSDRDRAIRLYMKGGAA